MLILRIGITEFGRKECEMENNVHSCRMIFIPIVEKEIK